MKHTPTDDSLPHQVRFVCIKSKLYISCTCRRVLHKSNWCFDPIAESHTIETARRLYNDPINHRAPFTDEDKAKW